MPKQPIEELIIKWIYEDMYRYKDRPLSPAINAKYIKALLDIAGSDGVLTDAEKKWVLGYGAARGLLNKKINFN
jgi:hypothetical protein